MASALLSPASSAHAKSLSLPFTIPITQNQNSLFSFIKCPNRSNKRCNAFSESTIEGLVNNVVSLPIIGSGFEDIQRIADSLPESEKLGIVVFAGLAWIYLTARPGVLLGAIDAYFLAPLQVAFDSLTGRRRLKRSDFIITDKLGEGSFGVVYSGVVVPKNVNVEAGVPNRSVAKALESDERFKEKVILKQVKLGVQGAKECGDFEEWFNYRLSRAAPDTCAEFLGSFIADKTNSQYTKGGKCLVWKFEVPFK